MLLWRKTIFYVFVLIYLIVCPLLILYSLGIIFKPADQSLQKTGIIDLSTIPPGAVVTINQKHFTETTPTIIRDLRPGEYTVNINLANYKPWVKNLTVKETKATIAKDILLIPEQWNLKEVSHEEYEELIPMPEVSFCLLKKGQCLKDLFIFHWKNQNLIENEESLEKAQMTPLVSEEFPFSEAEIKHLYLTPGSPFLLADVQWQEHRKFLWINGNLKIPEMIDITDLLINEEPDMISWDPKSHDILYNYHAKAVTIIDIATKTIRPHLFKNIRTLALYNNRVYTFMKDYRLKRFNEKGENPRILLHNPQLGIALFGRHKTWHMHVLSDNIIIFLNEKGGLLSNRLPYQLVSSGIKGFQFEKNNQRLLIWKKDDIGFIDFTKSANDEIFEKGPKLTWFHIPAKNVQQALWINRGSQILFVDDNMVFIMETASFEQTEIYKITDIKEDSSIAYSESLGRLFFLKQTTHDLSSIKIVPHDAMLSLPGANENGDHAIKANEPKTPQ